MPTGPDDGRVGRCCSTRSPRPRRISVAASTVRWKPERDRVEQACAGRAWTELRAGSTRRARPGPPRSGGAQRDRDVALRAVGMLDGEGHLLAGVRAQVASRGVAWSTWSNSEELLAVDGDDQVAASRRRSDCRSRRVPVGWPPCSPTDAAGLSGSTRADAHVRHRVAKEGDAGEDDEGEQRCSCPRRRAGSTSRVGSRWSDERVRIVRLALLPFHAHEAADGQPVERVGRALLVACSRSRRAAGSRCRTRGP